jgi:hypothetical protein
MFLSAPFDFDFDIDIDTDMAEGRSSGCSPQGVLLDFMTVVLSIVQGTIL